MKKNSSETLVNLLALAIVLVVAVIFWERVKFPLLFAATLGVLIAIHEWGHFIAAKASGVRVYEFALGFGPKLITYMRRNGTDYTIRLLPIGGFVNPKGMQPDDPITADGINGRRPAERALVYLAGPVMNAILGAVILLFSGFLFGVPDEATVLVGQIEKKAEASRMQVLRVNGQPVTNYPRGLRVGDHITEVNGKKVDRAEVVTGEIHVSAGKPVTMTVLRGGKQIVLTGTPRLDKLSIPALVVTQVPPGTALPVRPGDQVVKINGKVPETDDESPDVTADRMLRENTGKEITMVVWREGKERMELRGVAGPVGIKLQQNADRYLGRLYFQPTLGQGPRASLGKSFSQGWRAIRLNLEGFAMLFSRPKLLQDNVGGVIAIGAILGQIDKLPAFHYFNVLASLSISLAVFNLLPIPVLDGGHMLVLTLEVLRRRRLEPETQRAVALVGMAIILVLFVLITYRDIIKHFG